MNKIRTVVILTLIFGFILSGCSVTDENKVTDENIASYPVELDESVRNEIDALFEKVLSRGTTYQECIEKASASYEKLIAHGIPTVHYCFLEFLYGDPSELKEDLMADVSKKIIKTVRNDHIRMYGVKGYTSNEGSNGREWFDYTYSNAQVLWDYYIYEEFQEYFPVFDLLLKIAGDIE